MSTCFRHEACLYEGRDGFVGATLPFVRAGLEADDVPTTPSPSTTT